MSSTHDRINRMAVDNYLAGLLLPKDEALDAAAASTVPPVKAMLNLQTTTRQMRVSIFYREVGWSVGAAWCKGDRNPVLQRFLSLLRPT